MSQSTFRIACSLALCFLCAKSNILFAQTGALPTNPYRPHFLRTAMVSSPISSERCKPEYPRASMRNEETGVTTVEFKTEDTGRIFDLRVVNSSGFKGLDNAVLMALKNCRFRPASIDGKAVQGHTYLQYVWRLD